MLELIYAPSFIRELKKLEKDLRDEVLEKLELFKNPSNHKQLKVHKLKGYLKNSYSFSVNYSFRIVFSYASKKSVNVLAIGDHGIYK
jgi:mRNA-degrading endonuclease RelE of RelBE toxin-antitoxin system